MSGDSKKSELEGGLLSDESPIDSMTGLSALTPTPRSEGEEQVECPQCRCKSVFPQTPTPRSPEAPRFCQHCQLPLMRLAGKYEVLRKLDQGGNGVVYLVRHAHLQSKPLRVIKFLRTDLISTNTSLRRFQREIEVTAELSQCNEHIVRVYDDFGEVPLLGCYYVMEYLEGFTLRDFMDRQRPPPLDVALHIFIQLCDVASSIHDAGVIHRDLKPLNVHLVERKDDPYFVKLMDFGIARLLRKSMLAQTQGGAAGTPQYMAPEQFLGERGDHRSDIYALGLILYELLTGTFPFKLAGNETPISLADVASMHILETPNTLSEGAPDLELHEGFQAIVDKALEKHPEVRYESVDAMLSTLQALINESDVILSSGSYRATDELAGSRSLAIPPAVAVTDDGLELVLQQDSAIAQAIASLSGAESLISKAAEELDTVPGESRASIPGPGAEVENEASEEADFTPPTLDTPPGITPVELEEMPTIARPPILPHAVTSAPHSAVSQAIIGAPTPSWRFPWRSIMLLGALLVCGGAVSWWVYLRSEQITPARPSVVPPRGKLLAGAPQRLDAGGQRQGLPAQPSADGGGLQETSPDAGAASQAPQVRRQRVPVRRARRRRTPRSVCRGARPLQRWRSAPGCPADNKRWVSVRLQLQPAHTKLRSSLAVSRRGGFVCLRRPRRLRAAALHFSAPGFQPCVFRGRLRRRVYCIVLKPDATASSTPPQQVHKLFDGRLDYCILH